MNLSTSRCSQWTLEKWFKELHLTYQKAWLFGVKSNNILVKKLRHWIGFLGKFKIVYTFDLFGWTYFIGLGHTWRSKLELYLNFTKCLWLALFKHVSWLTNIINKKYVFLNKDDHNSPIMLPRPHRKETQD